MNENCHVEPVEKAVTAEQVHNADRALLSIGGMGCSNCAMRVCNGLIAVDGVYRADVYLNMGMAEVLYDSTKLSAEALTEAVRQAGNDGHHEYHALVIARG